MSENRVDVCAYCGSPSPTTRDHIPPKAVFPAPRPLDLITVPSCHACNQGASKSDELFRTYLSLRVGVDTPLTGLLWSQALDGIRHNRRLHRRILQGLQPLWLTTPAGVTHGRSHGGSWDPDAHDPTIERMIRGLYFHHYDEVLGPRVRVNVYWYRALEPSVLEATAECEQRTVGDGQFVYRFGRASDGPLHSIWLFEFHKRHWAGGYTAPVEISEERDAQPDSG